MYVHSTPIDSTPCVAVIRPMTSEPHWRSIKKCDPVTRGELYRKSWQTHRAPGEKNHNGLRWSVREHMLQHDVVVEKVGPSSHCQHGDDNKGVEQEIQICLYV